MIAVRVVSSLRYVDPVSLTHSLGAATPLPFRSGVRTIPTQMSDLSLRLNWIQPRPIGSRFRRVQAEAEFAREVRDRTRTVEVPPCIRRQAT